MQLDNKQLRALILKELKQVIAESSDDYLDWAESEDVIASIDAYYKACKDAAKRLDDDLATSIGAKDEWVKRCLAAVKRSIGESPEKTIF